MTLAQHAGLTVRAARAVSQRRRGRQRMRPARPVGCLPPREREAEIDDLVLQRQALRGVPSQLQDAEALQRRVRQLSAATRRSDDLAHRLGHCGSDASILGAASQEAQRIAGRCLVLPATRLLAASELDQTGHELGASAQTSRQEHEAVCPVSLLSREAMEQGQDLASDEARFTVGQKLGDRHRAVAHEYGTALWIASHRQERWEDPLTNLAADASGHREPEALPKRELGEERSLVPLPPEGPIGENPDMRTKPPDAGRCARGAS